MRAFWPIRAGTAHGYVTSGRIAVRMDDGQEPEFGPSDAFVMPGHGTWIVSDEPCELIDFTGARAKPSRGRWRSPGLAS